MMMATENTVPVDMGEVGERVGRANRTELARELGVTRSHVSQVLSGKSVPSLSVAARIARNLGVSLDGLNEYLEQVAVN